MTGRKMKRSQDKRILYLLVFALLPVTFLSTSEAKPNKYSLETDNEITIGHDLPAVQDAPDIIEVDAGGFLKSFIRVFNDEVLQDDENTDEPDKNTESPIPTTVIPVKTERTPPPEPKNRMETGRLIVMILISFSIPVGFMTMLFWRLRKEKQYMNSREELYRETVIVPSHAHNNANANNTFNVSEMHTTLYDTPPEYDEVITDANAEEKSESKSKLDLDDIPPPAYSTVYF